jgi:catechol 2,3-dioxygenase-like lactoylglutathione lyase family enzyme
VTTPFRELHHICIVVRDIGKSVAYYESIGIGPWQDYPPLTEYTRLTAPNPDAFFLMRYKLVNLGQPPELDCPQRRFLDSRGEGVFHIGFEADVDEAAAAGTELGLNVLARGQRDDGSGFIYFDTLDPAAVVLLARKTAR